ncbi:hypothetical protein ACJIZ3_008248 [Penstemon smallii]|uniref:C2 NT-type domain-containing protein n=1 Tax=Penstemon smallii TaxID=265156 RepID=A0ABD3TAW8_9LAMI
MFKSARWRSEKNKFKVVFKLQFHAAQLTQVGADALMVFIVPADTGKATVKSEKATIRDGSCFWENPVYETVKFNRDQKSGKIHERMYNFVVGTGSSKAGFTGEASIDFSIYAEATKVCLASLPLKNSKTEALLHVSIQRINDSTDQRDVEESENAKVITKDHSLRTQLGYTDINGTIKSNSTEDVPLSKNFPQITELNVNRRGSSGSDLTMSSSESSSGVEIPWEPPMKNEPAELLSSLKPQAQKPEWEWLGNSAIEASMNYSSSTPRETFLSQNSEEASDIMIEKLKTEIAALSRQAEMSEVELQTLRKQIVKESKRGNDLFKEVVGLKEERDALKGECEKRKTLAKSKSNMYFEGGDSQAIIEELRQELNHAKELNTNLQIQLQKTQESNSELILAVRDLDEMLELKNQEILNIANGSLTKVEMLQEVDPMFQQGDDNDDEEQRELEELVKEHKDAKEAYLLEQQIIDLRNEIEIYKRDKDELEMQMEQLALDYEIMKQENHDMSNKMEQSELQEQLKLQYECSSSYTANELESQIENLENELKKRSREFSDSLVTISELQSQIENLENELKKRSREFSDSLATVSELESHIENLEAELKKRSREFSDSLDTINELENQIVNLENELKKGSKEFSDSLATISELEAHVKNLEEELDKQAQGFEADLEALTCSKVEQEQRAIRAEETLRKTRWQNANTAERLQEEFKRLSVQMTSTFEANEKLAGKALTEANELRFQKIHLEEMLRKTSGECESIKDHYEETQRVLSDEISMLKDEIETLIAKNKIILEDKETLKNELGQTKVSIKEMELLVEQGNDERLELESSIMVLKNGDEESRKELNQLRCLLEEKELKIGNLQSELESIQSRYTELKHSLLNDEPEKEKLKKQVIQLKSDLKKREDALHSMEKKINDGSGRGVTSKTGKPLPRGSKEVANMKERIKLLEGQIKLKEAALETSANTFMEKEKDLHNKIEELERRLEVLIQNSDHYCENEVKKFASIVENRDNCLREAERDYKNETAFLKERNKAMEEELMDMQERYSEISLKFAEVEGERQQLVMKVRNLKNANKSS